MIRLVRVIALGLCMLRSCANGQKGLYQLYCTQNPVTAFVFSSTPPGAVVQKVYVTPQKVDNAPIRLRYKMASANAFFDVDATNGNILVKGNLRFMIFKDEYRLATFTIEVSVEDEKVNGTLVPAIIRVQKETDCKTFVKNVCFNIADSESRAFSVVENEEDPAVLTAHLVSSIAKLFCPQMKIAYRILSGNPFVYFHSPVTTATEAVLYAQSEIDRENVTEVHFSIECFANDSESGFSEKHEMDFTLTVVDIDDSPPGLRNQALKVVDVFLEEKGLKENHELPFLEQLILVDRDSREKNEFEIRMKPLGFPDVTRFFRIEHSTFEYMTGTVIKIGPVSLVNTKVTESSSFEIEVKDTKYLSPNNTLRIQVNIHPGYPPTNTTPQSPPSSPYAPDVNVLNYRISRQSCTLRRIGNPFETLLKTLGKAAFSVVPDQEQSQQPFQVTSREGIIYLAKPGLLYRSKLDHFVLEIEWNANGEKNVTLVTVHVLDETRKLARPRGFQCTSKEFCAERRSKADCQQLRNAFGTEGSCEWREETKRHGDTFTQAYGTCSTNLGSCPDGNCDELERSNWSLCPQDCTESVVGTGNLGSGERGIKTAVGVCSCDETRSCSCAPEHETGSVGEELGNLTFSTVNPTSLRSSESLALDQVSEEAFIDGICGTTCLALVAVGVFTLITVICGTAITVIMRNKNLQKKKARHLGSTMSLSAVPSDYVDERERILTNESTAEATTLQQLGTEVVIEDKWMIPRGYLIMDKTLGEGEFGKVIRAKALNVAGTQAQGLTTVAVKMAKMSGGGESDTAMRDLWSEFSLLKEVDHPHVIKLIGASLTNNELLLVLEYAEHGSLRSYLRRSRKLDAEDSVETEYVRPEVTPRNILSFAWQISQGMTYLADMKLVHRDLAARNILVASGNVAKISDFGLTRDVYEEDTYLKRSKGRVPVKWMAPESLADQLYTSKSDVWSFGILLWELTTLGSTPYPGTRPEKLYRLLKSGHRMERPDNCSQELYSIMLHCWEESPSDRPSFQELVGVFDRMLAAGAEYLDLTSLLVNNPGYIGEVDSDDQEENEIVTRITENPRSRISSEEPSSFGDADVTYLIPKNRDPPLSSIQAEAIELI